MTPDPNETLFAQQQVVRLQALLEASRQIHSTIALDDVLNIVLAIVVRELELTGAFFTSFPQTYGDTLGDGAHTQTSFPLHDKSGKVFSKLVILTPPTRTLSLDERDFLESLAIQAGVAIENARFHQRTVEWQRLESDLASARQVQRSLLPQQMPHIPGYTLAMRSVTCYAVGGDYLDIVPPPPGQQNGDITIVVADVAGKGLASALVTTSFRSAFRAMVNSGVPLLDIATRMNALHWNEGEQSRRRYVTAIFLQLDPATDTMLVVNCGHNPAFLLSPAPHGPVIQTIKASGTPVGLLPFSTYQTEKYSLPPGARLLLYTDGLTEVFRGEEEFGDERLLSTFQQCTSAASEEVIDCIWTTLDNFGDGQEQSDDMTAMVLLRQVQTGG